MINLIGRMIKVPSKKVIYLDIDGVLNSDDFAAFCLKEEGYDPFDLDELDPRAIKNLKYIVENTGASIVLSSSWRWDKDAFTKVKQQLKVFDLEVKDTTIMELWTTMSRTAEIKRHLAEHPEIENYVILDDANIEEPLTSHWARCLFKNGLTRKVAEEAIKILEEK